MRMFPRSRDCRFSAARELLFSDGASSLSSVNNVSYAFDGATTTTTFQTYNLTGSERQNYDKDVTFTTRNQAGTEKWIFTITDKDGNIVQKQIVLTVQ